MNSSATLIVMSLFVMILIALWGRLRWSQLNVADVYVLMVGVFLGGYSFVDGLVANQFGYEPVFIVWTFVWVMMVAAATWLISQRIPKQMFDVLSMRHLTSQWACVDGRFILFLLVAVIAFTMYGYSQFWILSHVSFESLRRLNIFLPYWYTSSMVFIQPILFCIFLAGTTKLFANRGRKRLIWSVVLALTFFLIAMYGRRAVFYLLFIFLIIRSFHKRENLFSLAGIRFLLLLIPVLLIFSNIYQNYRPFIRSYQSMPRQSALPNILEAVVDTGATASNLRNRMAMWKFNYIIIEKQMYSCSRLPLGSVLFQGFKNGIPRVFWPQKNVYDLDEMVARAYGLPVTDYPTNNFAMAQADLGYLSIFLLPIQMLITFFIISIISIFAKQMPGLVLIMTGFLLYHIVGMEKGYAGVFILYRDIFILCAIYLIGHCGIKIFLRRE